MNKSILATEEIQETSEYIESLANAPDNTNSAELMNFAAEIIREINQTEMK